MAVTAAGCGSSPAQAGDPVARLGAVPIPTAPSTVPTAAADETHPQLLAMGAPVVVTLPTARGLIVADGPEVPDLKVPTAAPSAQDNPVLGILTLHLMAYQGSFRVSLADLSSRDENGTAIKLSVAGPDSVTVDAGKPVKFAVRGDYHDGAAQLTLRHDGKVIAVWDFSMELD